MTIKGYETFKKEDGRVGFNYIHLDGYLIPRREKPLWKDKEITIHMYFVASVR